MDAVSRDIIFSYLPSPKDRVLLSLVSRYFHARYYYIALCNGFECGQKLVCNLGSCLLTCEESENIGLLAMMDTEEAIAASRAFASSKLIEIGQLPDVATCAIVGTHHADRVAQFAEYQCGEGYGAADSAEMRLAAEDKMKWFEGVFGEGLADDSFGVPPINEVLENDPLIADLRSAPTYPDRPRSV